MVEKLYWVTNLETKQLFFLLILRQSLKFVLLRIQCLLNFFWLIFLSSVSLESLAPGTTRRLLHSRCCLGRCTESSIIFNLPTTNCLQYTNPLQTKPNPSRNGEKRNSIGRKICFIVICRDRQLERK